MSTADNVLGISFCDQNTFVEANHVVIEQRAT